MHYLLNLRVIHIILDVLFHLSPGVPFQSVFLLFRGDATTRNLFWNYLCLRGKKTKRNKRYFGHSSASKCVLRRAGNYGRQTTHWQIQTEWPLQSTNHSPGEHKGYRLQEETPCDWKIPCTKGAGWWIWVSRGWQGWVGGVLDWQGGQNNNCALFIGTWRPTVCAPTPSQCAFQAWRYKSGRVSLCFTEMSWK